MTNTAEMTPENNVVGVDDGHDGIKVYAGQGIMFRMPSRAKHGHTGMGEPEAIRPLNFYVNGEKYTVNPNIIDAIETRTENYPRSGANVVLIHQALRLAGFSGRTLKVVTGLPVNRFYGGINSSMNDELIEEKRLNLLNTAVINCDDAFRQIEPIKFDRHFVVSEAEAAFYDLVLDEKGKKTNKFNSFMQFGVAIVDIGGRTTDCIVMNPGNGGIQADYSGTIDIGVMKFRDNLKADLRALLKTQKIPEHLLDDAVLTGFYGPRRLDVSDLVKRHKLHIVNEISSFIESKVLQGENEYECVAVVGGGAIVFKVELLAKFPNWTFVENPEFANARGMYKLAKFIKKN